MSSWITSFEGTPAAETLAFVLVLLSAASHAVFGIIFKGGIDTYINRGAINVCYSLIVLPFALFVLPWPSHEMWIVLSWSFLAHMIYELLQARAYSMGAFTLVYPVARGTGPIATALLAFVAFSEHLTLLQWLALFALSGAIFSLAFVNLRDMRADAAASRGMTAALIAAVATGAMSAVFMNIDALGTRMGEDPLTFVAWFFVLGMFSTPIFALARWRYRARNGLPLPTLKALAIRGFLGAVVALTTFGAMMVATRLAKLGEIVALRETSIAFAAILGVLFFGERLNGARIVLIALIAASAMAVQLAG
ncbi:EamA family transporter [Tepidamorphus sp. 3E244]|uniref:EamA family transporter n=1 Tax=Tepidamorphus sp. 3E244 TaxID=3385498 RepID=UPI0038FC93E5